MAFLELSNLVKTFGANRVVKDFDLSIDKGEFVSLLGPSGCGKTTVLRMVAGFETPTAGTIHIDGQDVTGQKPNERAIGMMFQAYALFPNMTVADNVAFGLKVKGVARGERDKVVAEMLRLIGLPDLGGRFPFQLSGGQQQRVALARALAVRPRVLLLDEPLSALDAKIRVSLRTEIREIQRELGITAVFVTHDQEEALSMSDRVVVMNGGIAEQVGTPFEVYNRPTTRFVATFVGTLNLFEAEAEGAGALRIGGVTVRLSDEMEATRGGRLTVALRPESLHLGAGEVTLPAKVEAVEFLGSILRIKARVAGTQVALDTFNRADAPPPAVGVETSVSFSARDLVVLNA
ncbi:spermidine/putrescine ABC transporter ATP-binding protein [Gemmobacter aquarius]|uniref:Spermidine/putrescine ABC transporter ATP-binding protein n=1 Tax=Paragemmobacter aquarius TaxID=2169400 RepID=A0A2S0UMV5_9RHOB|nr:ABC transporter ATP-binding protein [Gemmobacter aquarius]AWB49137.1 spermidine/putrescine ABC transporter ATP-binding protein [Gemmobacter aquarius]